MKNKIQISEEEKRKTLEIIKSLFESGDIKVKIYIDSISHETYNSSDSGETDYVFSEIIIGDKKFRQKSEVCLSNSY